MIRGRIYFSIGERKDCYSITIYNDDTQENTETVTVTLNRTSGLDSRIRLEDIAADVSILDADSKRGRGTEGGRESNALLPTTVVVNFSGSEGGPKQSCQLWS